ncbi:MAG: hypothetical protein ACTSV9_05500 [Candidatus Thorarchaeota archaeon]
MIEAAALYNLRGTKVLASISFIKKGPSEEILQTVIQEFFELAEVETLDKCIQLKVNGWSVCLVQVDKVTLIAGFTSSSEISTDDVAAMQALDEAFKLLASETSKRNARQSFDDMVSGFLKKRLSICFFSASSPASEDKSGSAVAMLVKRLSDQSSPYTKPVSIGPYNVIAMRHTTAEVPKTKWPDHLEQVQVFVLVVAPPLPSAHDLGAVIDRIRANSKATILVVPGSDEELEFARRLELLLDIDLCDSVSSSPTDLLLSVLAMSGFTDMHPELAREKWVIDQLGTEEKAPVSAEKAPDIGHQAFFVIDKTTGTPHFSYFYESESEYLRRAPNVVAAISQFDLDSSGRTETSLLQTGELKYAILEREGLIFTLVTGDKEDPELVRSRFSILPSIYFDEMPKETEDPSDLYSYGPFMIKLLATIPSENWSDRTCPTRIKEPDWLWFQSDLMSKFLETVWNSVDGQTPLSQLVVGKGPGMVLGALHYLKRMGAIDTKLLIIPSDIPDVIQKPSAQVLSLYSHSELILGFVDGKSSIESIASKVGIDEAILFTFFSELYRRGYIELKFANTTSP